LTFIKDPKEKCLDGYTPLHWLMSVKLDENDCDEVKIFHVLKLKIKAVKIRDYILKSRDV
jgi:hypothetical protein